MFKKFLNEIEQKRAEKDNLYIQKLAHTNFNITIKNGILYIIYDGNPIKEISADEKISDVLAEINVMVESAIKFRTNK